VTQLKYPQLLQQILKTRFFTSLSHNSFFALQVDEFTDVTVYRYNKLSPFMLSRYIWIWFKKSMMIYNSANLYRHIIPVKHFFFFDDFRTSKEETGEIRRSEYWWNEGCVREMKRLPTLVKAFVRLVVCNRCCMHRQAHAAIAAITRTSDYFESGKYFYSS